MVNLLVGLAAQYTGALVLVVPDGLVDDIDTDHL
jgi:hypothetical protein